MAKELAPLEVSPEAITVMNTYLQNGCSMKETAVQLNMPIENVSSFLSQRPVKALLDQQFQEQGFRNRDRMFSLLDEIINAKIEEMEETGMLPDMDIVTLLEKQHKMKMQELQMSMKLQETTNLIQNNNTTNIQINGGENYNALLDKIIKGKR